MVRRKKKLKLLTKEQQIKKVVDLYKKGKSQSEISDETGINFDSIVKWTNKLGHTVGKIEEDDRVGDDPASQQYYGRTVKTSKRHF